MSVLAGVPAACTIGRNMAPAQGIGRVQGVRDKNAAMVGDFPVFV